MSDLSNTPLTVVVFEDAVIVSEPGSVRPVALTVEAAEVSAARLLAAVRSVQSADRPASSE